MFRGLAEFSSWYKYLYSLIKISKIYCRQYIARVKWGVNSESQFSASETSGKAKKKKKKDWSKKLHYWHCLLTNNVESSEKF